MKLRRNIFAGFISLLLGSSAFADSFSSSGAGVSSVTAGNSSLSISPDTGAVVISLSPTPTLGAATGTSLALGGATLGSNAFAVTGRANFASVGSASAPTLSVGNQTTGIYSVGTTQIGFSVNGVDKLNYGVTTASTWTTTSAVSVGFLQATGGVSTGGNVNGTALSSSFILGVSSDTVWSRASAGVYQVGLSGNNALGSVKTANLLAGIVYSVAGTPLPSAATLGVGARAFVSDATACTLGTTYAGSSTTACPVYSDGTNWKEGG